MAELTEDQLIEAVLRVRESIGNVSAGQMHAALTEQGVKVTMPQVKKACSKATKRVGVPAAQATAPAAEPPAEPSAAKLAKQEAKQKAKMKADAAALKAAENDMMEAQRKLRVARSGSKEEAVTITGSAEEFIQKITGLALAATLEDGDTRCMRERVEADIAALEWVKLALATGALSLSQDVVALGMELQLTRLKEVRDAKDYSSAAALYAEEKREHDTLDQAMQRSQAVAAAAEQQLTSSDPMAEMD